ncbi:hypothetical protein R9C00_14715 [Flammeovirgaceae bacterium SG7u.111]|nr:hypothetical protein [Flammeovirgaceae bacterium SG7u.132]WPO38711.1 hypothetical protein R9C00_14715 [Flammeovirgaceae bacterium SG7u.111]
MQKLNSIYKDFTSIKGVALLVYAVVVYADLIVYSRSFSYVITAEAVLFGMYLAAINNERPFRICTWQIMFSVGQIALFLFLLYFFNDYRGYYSNFMTIKFWGGIQVVFLGLFYLFMLQQNKKTLIIFISLLLGAVAISAFSIANETIYGNNRHLYLPLTGFGLLYCATAYFFGRLSKSELETEE